MKKLVKVEVAFDLMDKNFVYTADVDEPRTKGLLAVGYISLVKTAEDLLVTQNESELEGTAKVGDSAPGSKKSGKISA